MRRPFKETWLLSQEQPASCAVVQMKGRVEMGKANSVTINEVARQAGVSAMTVSNVLNDKGRASTFTRQHVRTVAARLGYSGKSGPPAATQSSPAIGLLYAYPESPFVSAVLVGALNAASAAGMQLLTRECPQPSLKLIRSGLNSLKCDGARAMLLLPPFAEVADAHGLAAELGLPMATVGTGTSLSGIATTRIDDRKAAYQSTRMLVGQGHRRIGFVAGRRGHSAAAARREGFRAALRDHRISYDDLEVEGDWSFASGVSGARALLGAVDPPTAIVACNDEMAAGVIWLAQCRGLAVPEKLAVAGFDDTPLAAQVFPSLTVVHQPIASMAQKAIRALIFEMREGKGRAPVRDTLIDFTLIQRRSTGA